MGGINSLFSDIQPQDESEMDQGTKNALDALTKLETSPTTDNKAKVAKVAKTTEAKAKTKATKPVEAKAVETKVEVAKTTETKVKPKSKKVTKESKATESTVEVKSKKVENKETVNKIRDIEELTPDIATKLGLEENYAERYQSLPKKAKSKFINLVNWFLFDEQLSIYTLVCFKQLVDKTEVKSSDLKIALMSNTERPYPVTTASSQAGQLMAIFPAMDIGQLNDKTIVLKSTSPLVIKFENKY